MNNFPPAPAGKQCLRTVLPYLKKRFGWPYDKGWHVIQEMAELDKIKIVYRHKYQGDPGITILTTDRDLSDLSIFDGIWIDDAGVITRALTSEGDTDESVALPPSPAPAKRGRRLGQCTINDTDTLNAIRKAVAGGDTVNHACVSHTAGMRDKEASAAIRRWTRKLKKESGH